MADEDVDVPLPITFLVDWMTDVCCCITGVVDVVEEVGGVDDVPGTGSVVLLFDQHDGEGDDS